MVWSDSQRPRYGGDLLLLARRIKASLRRTNASSGPASLGLPSDGHHLTWFAAAYSYEPLAARYCNCAASLSETGRAHQLYASSSPHPWAGLRAFDARHAVAAAVQPARRTGHFSRRTGRRTTGDGTEAGSKSEHLVRRSSTSGAVEGIKAKRGLQPRTVTCLWRRDIAIVLPRSQGLGERSSATRRRRNLHEAGWA